MRAFKKKLKHIHASAADLLHIRIRNLGWCKCGHYKNEARETDCLDCREMNAMLIASTKIPEREGSRGNLIMQILWVTTQLLVTRICFV